MTKHKRFTRVAAVCVAAAALLAFVPSSAHAEQYTWTRQRSQKYLMGDYEPLFLAGSCGLGTVCFGRMWAEHVAVDIVDKSGRPVGGVLRFDNGWRAVTIPFCRHADAWMTPGEAVSVILDSAGDVRAYELGSTSPGCTDLQPGGRVATTRGATRGVVRATFTRYLESD